MFSYPHICKAHCIIIIILLLFAKTIYPANFIENNYFVEELVVSGQKFHKTVYCFHEDSRGFLWIGTTDGLYRYDGESLHKFSANHSSENGLLSNRIMKIAEADNGELFIATIGGGLSRFIWSENKFVNYLHDPDDPHSIARNDINTLVFQDDNQLWIGFRNGQLDRFDIETGIFTHYNAQTVEGFDKVVDISELIVTHNNTLWIGTWQNGLFQFQYNGNTGNVHQVPLNAGKQPESPVTSIFSDNKGIIWVGNRNGELFAVEDQNLSITAYTSKSLNDDVHVNEIISLEQQILAVTNSGPFLLQEGVLLPMSFQLGQLSSNLLISALVDSYGNIWIGSNKGIVKLRRKKFNFQALDIGGDYLDITALSASGNNELFLGTWGQGIYKTRESIVNNSTGQINPVMIDPVSNANINDMEIVDGTILLGLQNRGLLKLSPDNTASEMLFGETVTAIHLIDSILLFLGTNNGLYLADLSGNIFKHYEADRDNPNSLSDNKITTIKESTDGVYWIGTILGGLNKAVFNPQSLNIEFTTYRNNYNNYRTLSSDYVTAIYEDSNGALWIGSENGGLNKMMLEEIDGTDSIYFDVYTETEGLFDNKILSIVEDKNANLWITGRTSLTRFNPQDESFVNYTNFDISSFGHFGSQNASLVNSNELLVFGGLGGIISFYPDSIKQVPAPEIFITGLNIQTRSGESFDVNHNHSITGFKPLWASEEITLPRDLKACSFDFIGIDLYSPEQVTYAYRLLGFENEWNLIGANGRMAKYTNLNPGNYTFEVKAFNSDGVESITPRQLHVKVMTPLWRTWWALVIYSALIVLFYLMVRRIIYIKANLENEIKIERIRRENEHELNQMKLNFFTDISHELRTPLTLVIGPLEHLANKLKGNDSIKDDLKIIDRNARRLSNLIEQVMDIRKIEKGHLVINPETHDLVALTQEILNSFKSQASFKNISFRFLSENKQVNAKIDKDKFEKVITNLISNAFKYTPSGENVVVELFFSKPDSSLISFFGNNLLKVNSIKIAVINTGNPIPRHLKEKLFERFYRGENILNSEAGIGLGLSIAKDLAEIQGGHILIESDAEKGNCFLFNLPLDHKFESKSDVKVTINELDRSGSLRITTTAGDDIDLQIDENENQNLEDRNQNQKVILVIEDDIDLLNFIDSVFKDEYRVIKSSDGTTGLKYALDEMPNLIISDIMLPGIGGKQICEEVKKDIRSSHIPVILLTARVEMKEQIEGIETGADAYITKPFDIDYLKTRVRKLIEQRQVMIERFSTELTLNTKHVTKGKIDQDFMNLLVEKIVKNLTNTELRIEDLSHELKMSRIQLYRKIKFITGSSPSEFIRSVRLKHAAQKILDGNLNISEIAYSTGFNSPNYFTTCFKKQFGVTPKEFGQKNKIE